MEDKIRDLYKELRNMIAGYLIYQNRNNCEKIKKVMPQIQEFVLWFIEENKFGIEEELYNGLKENLLYILSDVLDAINQGDIVLLNDAVAYGFMDYLELFVDLEEEK